MIEGMNEGRKERFNEIMNEFRKERLKQNMKTHGIGKEGRKESMKGRKEGIDK